MSLNLIPHSPAPLTDLLTRAAFAPIENFGWLRVTGEDRVRWLNGMTTNNIAGLKPGEGCYTFFLNAQGRIQADATAWMLEDSILLETASPGSLATMLDHYIIMDDVELDVVESGGNDRKWFAANQPEFPRPINRVGLTVAGPQAPALLAPLGLSFRSEAEEPASLPGEGQIVSLRWRSANIDVLQAPSTIVPSFELWADPQTITALAASLTQAGKPQATPEALEHLRILSGTPLFGTDIRDKDLPQETNQTRALHFNKGCYLGQEIVERIRSRGAVHRTFSGFLLEGDLPAPGAALTAEEKPVGELTSVARIQLPGGPVQLALGYIRREALDRNATILYPGGTAQASTLPFQLPEMRA